MRPSRHRVSERGFSMVELLVAMLIGLIGMIIIFQVFEVSESIKRSTTSGGDAQQNGVISLYTMERDFKNGGMGFNDTTFVGCNIVGFDNKRATPNFPPAGVTMKLAPVFITSGAATTAPDQISVLYGSQPQAAASVPLSADMAAPTDDLFVTNPFGYKPGDLLLLVEPNSGKNCSIMEFNRIGASSNQLKHDNASYLSGAVARTPRFNAIANGSLTVTSQFLIDNGQPVVTSVADNIVHMRALYGLDDGNNDATVPYNVTPTAGDGIVDRYVDAATFNALLALAPVPTPWARLIAVRIALVSRSALPEKPSSGKLSDPCDATTADPQWTGTPWAGAPFNYQTRLDVSSSVAAPDDWKCYRYRVFETTIPLRNWIWK